MKKKSFFVKFFVLSLISCITFFAFADSLNDALKKQEELNSKMNSAQSKLNQKAAEQKKVKNELYSINKTLEKTKSSLDQLTDELAISEEQITKINEEILLKQGDLDIRTEVLKERLTSIYKHGDVNFLEVMFDSTSFSDFLTRYELMKILAKSDSELLDEIELEKSALDEKKVSLEEEKNKLLSIRTEQEKKKVTLNNTSSRFKTTISKLEKQKNVYAKMVDDMEAQSRIVSQEIRKLQSSGGTSPTSLIWPTPGYYRISSAYGWRIHPILKTRRFHTGIDLPDPYGNKILATNSGKIILAKYNGAYGNCVIVDHGGGMSTMYAHMSTILVKVGQQVNKGQQIGKIGTSGWSTGAHLHFEVRINGEHTNPLKYAKK